VFDSVVAGNFGLVTVAAVSLPPVAKAATPPSTYEFDL